MVMIPPDALLYIYEIRGETAIELATPPRSFIGLWNEDDFAYLFFDKSEDDYVRKLVACSRSILGSRHEMRYKDWQSGLPEQGITLAGVHVVPPGAERTPHDAVVLDPSVVFGDGSHPTTASCLRALKRIVRTSSVHSMLDLGTGSGILAIAGVRMGIGHVLAVDKNRLAVSVAGKNVAANRMCSRIRTLEGEARWFVGGHFQLVAANLPFQVLTDLAVADGVDRHAFWIISGINEQQGRVLKELFAEQGFETIVHYDAHPWVTFALARRSGQ